MNAQQIAAHLSQEYDLSWASQVKLEAVADKLLTKFTSGESIDILNDLLGEVTPNELTENLSSV